MIKILIFKNYASIWCAENCECITKKSIREYELLLLTDRRTNKLSIIIMWIYNILYYLKKTSSQL